jgi:hypothetical protein
MAIVESTSPAVPIKYERSAGFMSILRRALLATSVAWEKRRGKAEGSDPQAMLNGVASTFTMGGLEPPIQQRGVCRARDSLARQRAPAGWPSQARPR